MKARGGEKEAMFWGSARRGGDGPSLAQTPGGKKASLKEIQMGGRWLPTWRHVEGKTPGGTRNPADE